MARKMKKFADGGRAQARFDRKVADIESDYQKWLKSGRYGSADVARAKYDQRMADARDDLAKWTGADRSSTRMDEQAAERRLGEARRTKGESMRRAAALDVTQKPDVSKIAAPDLGMGPKITTAASTRTAPRRRPASQVPVRREAPVPTQRPVATPPPSRIQQDYERGAAMRRAITPTSERVTPEMLQRIQDIAGNKAPAYNAFGDQPTAEQVRKQREARERARQLYEQARATIASEGKRKGGAVKKMAKGGSIDGCAVRGKTKAKRTR